MFTTLIIGILAAFAVILIVLWPALKWFAIILVILFLIGFIPGLFYKPNKKNKTKK